MGKQAPSPLADLGYGRLVPCINKCGGLMGPNTAPTEHDNESKKVGGFVALAATGRRSYTPSEIQRRCYSSAAAA